MGEIWMEEAVDSRSWSGGTLTHHYYLGGSANEWDVLTYLLNNCPSIVGAQMRETWPTLDVLWVDEDADDGAYDAKVRYPQPSTSLGRFKAPEINSVRIRGSTKGGSIHIVASLATVGAYGAGATTADNTNLICVNEDGSQVEGVDIGSGELSFTVVKVFPAAGLPNLGSLFSLSAPNHVNNATFTVTDSVTGLTITLAPGECLFKGSEFGESRADGGVEFSFDFCGLPNVTGLSFCGLAGIAKKGHEFLWPRSFRDVLTNGLTSKVKRAYVERVYPEGNFALLGI